MSEPIEKPKPKGVLLFGTLPLVPLIIGLIWLVMFLVNYFHGLSHNVSLPIVLGTLGWFVVWVIRAQKK